MVLHSIPVVLNVQQDYSVTPKYYTFKQIPWWEGIQFLILSDTLVQLEPHLYIMGRTTSLFPLL